MMEKIIVLATRNKHKLEEIRAIIPSVYALKSLADFKGAPDVAEDGETLRANAFKKARSAALYCGLWALADDTGLEVDFLKGAPGVYSARYAGPACDYKANNTRLLSEMAGVQEGGRTARFRCVMALVSPDGESRFSEGVLEGRITSAPRGGNGFGYDPVFEVGGTGRTLAEMSEEEKNSVSHRYEAIKAIVGQMEALWPGKR